MIPNFKLYPQRFTLFADDLKVGNPTDVEVLGLGSEVIKTDGPYISHRITAVVELSAVIITVQGEGECSICKVAAPDIDHSSDSLWHLLVSHSGDRVDLPFPWMRDQVGVVCGDCAAELQAARASVIAKRSK